MPGLSLNGLGSVWVAHILARCTSSDIITEYFFFYDCRLPPPLHMRGRRYKLSAEPISLFSVVLMVSKMSLRIGAR